MSLQDVLTDSRVISYLVSSFTASNYKWGFYAFGTISWVLLAFSTLFHGTKSARRVNVARDRKSYPKIITYSLINCDC